MCSTLALEICYWDNYGCVECERRWWNLPGGEVVFLSAERFIVFRIHPASPRRFGEVAEVMVRILAVVFIPDCCNVDKMSRQPYPEYITREEAEAGLADGSLISGLLQVVWGLGWMVSDRGCASEGIGFEYNACY